MMIDRETLLPCPFCGGDATLRQYETESLWSHDQVTYTQVGCEECDYHIATEPGYEMEAPERWNTRPDAALSALDQPAQEPVAWMYTNLNFPPGRPPNEVVFYRYENIGDNWTETPLYAAPQPATTDPLREIVFRYIDRMNDVAPECGDPAERIVSEFARDVNAVLQSEYSQPATLPDASR